MKCSTCATELQCPRCLRSKRIAAGIAASPRKGGAHRKHGPDVVAHINKLRDLGRSFKEIEAITGVSKASAHRLIQQAERHSL